MATRESRTTKGDKRSPTPRDKAVRVWSSVGITLCITQDPPQFLKLEFGHERLAKSSSVEEIRKTARLIDEFNEGELERRLDSYKRLFDRHEVAEEPMSDVKKRARKRARKLKGDG